MSNHIEQLMKAAGVRPVIRYYFYFINEEMEITKEALIQCAKAFTNLGKVTRVTREYPVFTPEKQLELIKLILKADNVDSFSQYYSEVLKAFVFTCKSLPEMNTYNVWESINTDYALALAELVLRLIEENQLDKSEVRRILEDG